MPMEFRTSTIQITPRLKSIIRDIAKIETETLDALAEKMLWETISELYPRVYSLHEEYHKNIDRIANEKKRRLEEEEQELNDKGE